MIKPPDWYLVAKLQLEIDQRQPRRATRAEEVTVLREPPRRVYGSVTVRPTRISDQDLHDRRFCAALGAALLAWCLPVWAGAICITQIVTG